MVILWHTQDPQHLKAVLLTFLLIQCGTIVPHWMLLFTEM